MNVKTLAAITGTLFILSLGVFYFENRRGTDLIEGSDYIKGLDLEKIQKISLSFSGNEKITFNRDGSHFVIENHKSYPASTEKINNLIFKIASLQVKEKITSKPSEEDLKNYSLNPENRQYLVEIFDNDKKKTVAFSVGRSRKGKGNYLYKEGGKYVYLSKDSIWLNSSYRDFISTLILDLKKDDIESIQLAMNGPTSLPIELMRKDNDFTLVKPEKKDFKKEKIEEYFTHFANLKFDEFYKYNDKEVQSLSFDKGVKILLKNKLTYNLSLSKKEDNHFIKITAITQDIPKTVTIDQKMDQEKMKEIENMAKAQSLAQRFNLKKGTWVYKVSPSTFSKLVKKTKDFL